MNQNIGTVIKQLCRRHKVGQGELAETLGVSVQAVSKWETGKANPDLYLLPKLAENYGDWISQPNVLIKQKRC